MACRSSTAAAADGFVGVSRCTASEHAYCGACSHGSLRCAYIQHCQQSGSSKARLQCGGSCLLPRQQLGKCGSNPVKDADRHLSMRLHIWPTPRQLCCKVCAVPRLNPMLVCRHTHAHCVNNSSAAAPSTCRCCSCPCSSEQHLKALLHQQLAYVPVSVLLMQIALTHLHTSDYIAAVGMHASLPLPWACSVRPSVPCVHNIMHLHDAGERQADVIAKSGVECTAT